MKKAGLPPLHLHDLWHTGDTMAADTGASTRELMSRKGHSTIEAALRYQHMRRERDRLIADAIDREMKKPRRSRSSNRRRHPALEWHYHLRVIHMTKAQVHEIPR